MAEPDDRVIHCCACNRYIMLPDDAGEGSVLTCPFCETKNQVALLTVFVGRPVEEA